MSDGDPHNRKSRLRNTVDSIKTCNQISDHNKDVILDFKKYLESQDLSIDRISRYFYSLKYVANHIEWDLDDPDKQKLIELVGDINRNELWEGERAESTKAEYKKLIRKLYKDYLDSKRQEVDGVELTDFFSATVQKSYVDPEELPRPRQVAKMVKKADRIRDKAYMMTLWTTSARIGAILGLKWKDIRFHRDIARVKFRDTKTGDDRKVPIAAAFPYLKDHKENDPKSDQPDEFVFRGIQTDNQLSYNGAYGIIERAAEKAEIPDHIRTNPHAWRKGRISELARKGLNEAQICKISGHIIGSEEIRIYCRLASEDVENSIRQEAGLETEEEKEESPLKPLKCHECNQLNKWECENCSRCGEVLTTSELFKQVKTQETSEEIRKEVVEEKTEWSNDKIDRKAKKLVEEELEEL